MNFNNSLHLFLEKTKYIDLDHPKISKLAKKIAGSYPSETEKAKALFHWVKENIKFEFGYWGIKASEVLKRKRGMCTNKANLLIALLRAVRIPAGYGILRVNTKEFYQELMCPSFKKLVSPSTVHIYVGIFLNNKWVRCDPSVDNELARALKKTNPFGRMTGFNISEKEIRNIKGILKRIEFLANIDKDLSKPPRHAKGITLKILNCYLKFLKEKSQIVKRLYSDTEIEKKFLLWLEEKNIYYSNFLKKLANS